MELVHWPIAKLFLILFLSAFFIDIRCCADDGIDKDIGIEPFEIDWESTRVSDGESSARVYICCSLLPLFFCCFLAFFILIVNKMHYICMKFMRLL